MKLSPAQGEKKEEDGTMRFREDPLSRTDLADGRRGGEGGKKETGMWPPAAKRKKKKERPTRSNCAFHPTLHRFPRKEGN